MYQLEKQNTEIYNIKIIDRIEKKFIYKILKMDIKDGAVIANFRLFMVRTPSLLKEIYTEWPNCPI